MAAKAPKALPKAAAAPAKSSPTRDALDFERERVDAVFPKDIPEAQRRQLAEAVLKGGKPSSVPAPTAAQNDEKARKDRVARVLADGDSQPRAKKLGRPRPATASAASAPPAAVVAREETTDENDAGAVRQVEATASRDMSHADFNASVDEVYASMGIDQHQPAPEAKTAAGAGQPAAAGSANHPAVEPEQKLNIAISAADGTQAGGVPPSPQPETPRLKLQGRLSAINAQRRSPPGLDPVQDPFRKAPLPLLRKTP